MPQGEKPKSHHTSSHVKRAFSRPGRPAPLTRRTTGSGPTLDKVEPHDCDEKRDMATSFPQYCATCEKQIMVPVTSKLYCSERCRRKDSCKPLSASAIAVSPTYSPTNLGPSPRTILPPLTPTATPLAIHAFARIPIDLHDHKSDLDPTEWKPKLQRPGLASRSSEAFRYLSQFHQSTSSAAGDEGGTAVPRQPFVHRSTTSMSTIPSLAHTPTTAASSVSSFELGYNSFTYDFSTRPLPPRHDPFSASMGSKMGIDLVTPHVVPATAETFASIEAPDSSLWAKKSMKFPAPVNNGGLGKLLSDSHERI